MRILLVGAGGVGTAFARFAARRPFADLVIADYDLGRAQGAAMARDGYEAVQLDARDEQATTELLARHRCDVLMNACTTWSTTRGRWPSAARRRWSGRPRSTRWWRWS